MSKNTIIYEPNYRSKYGFFETWAIMFGNIWRSRFLIQQLFLRDFFAVYKKSFLGIAWILIAPLAGIVSWVFLQKAGMLNPGKLEVPYPVYVLVGTLSWDFFAGILTAASRTLSSGKALVMQVNYPHETLFVKEIAHFLSNFILKLLLVLTVVLMFGVSLKWQIIFLPLVCLPTVFLAGAIGLVLSLFSVITQDVMKMMGMGLKLLMWTTPIIYSGNTENEILRLINENNPLTYIVCSIRDIILYGKLYGPEYFLYCAIGSLVIFLFSWRLFYLNEQRLIERMI